jgi:hypothetical protein
MRDVVYMLAGLVMIVAGIFGLTFLGYEANKFFAPRYAAIDNSVFHESAQYNDGMVRDLENLETQYRQTRDENEKAALKATIIHRFSIYPVERMPSELRNFYNEVRQ